MRSTHPEPSTTKPSEMSSLQKLISDHAPSSQWAHLFGSRKEAAVHFANVHQARLSLAAAKGPCSKCGAEHSGSVVMYAWQASFFSGLKVARSGEVRCRVISHVSRALRELRPPPAGGARVGRCLTGRRA
jgi:hypothetical protein